jgi:hypothetical protein
MCGTRTCEASKNEFYCNAVTNLCLTNCANINGLVSSEKIKCVCASTTTTNTAECANSTYCDTTGAVPRCNDVSLCTNVLGANVNAKACMCGSTKCTSTTSGGNGLFCTSSESRCQDTSDYISCANSNGTVANSAQCLCGGSGGTSSAALCQSNEYCTADIAHCAAEPRCAHGSGAITNNHDCTCGTSTCGSSGGGGDGLYCVSDDNVCGASAFENCSVVDGTSPVLGSSCFCGTSACGVGQYCLKSKHHHLWGQFFCKTFLTSSSFFLCPFCVLSFLSILPFFQISSKRPQHVFQFSGLP